MAPSNGKKVYADGVLVLFNQPHASTHPDRHIWRESDTGVLDEMRVVTEALQRLEIPFRTAGVRALEDIPDALTAGTESLVFNLVENLEGSVFDACLVPAVCRAMRRACTGNDSIAQTLCLDKWLAKAVLRAHGVPTPQAAVVPVDASLPRELPPPPLIVKPLQSDASEGIDSSSVLKEGGPAIEAAVRRVHRTCRQAAMIEQFIQGREVNVSVLQRGERIDVLPLAEIDFSAFPPDMPRIVDYAAKWVADSFECRNTPRKIPADLPDITAKELRRVSLMAWRAAGCQDYARVDFRVAEDGGVYVIEINPNPDLCPDCGFAAALASAGVSFDQFVRIVIENAAEREGLALRRRRRRRVELSVQGDTVIRPTAQADRDAILEVVARSERFRPDELNVAREVLDDSLTTEKSNEYTSLTAEHEGKPVGWVCFGPTACTLGTFDVYWIVVDPRCQGRGLGTRLLRQAEEEIALRGGRLSVVETSSRPAYDLTRRFYGKAGYREESRLRDFYAPGDDRVVYVKRLQTPTEVSPA